MSIRTWEAGQSAQIQLGGEIYPVVTQDDLIKAVVDGSIACDRLGGTLFVVLQRIPTGTPNEMVTTRALVTWQDRTTAKPQPEESALADAAPLESTEPPAPAPAAAVEDPDAGEQPTAVFDDGLRVDPEAVDLADVPQELQV